MIRCSCPTRASLFSAIVPVLSLTLGAAACPTVPLCLPSTCLGMDHKVSRPVWTTPAAGGPEAFASKYMNLLSNVPLANMGGGAGSSLYGWVDPVTRREYAIMGRSNGTAFIDVTDPINPIYVANMPKVAGSADTSWREPKVYQNTVYVGVDNTTHGMQVMDLTRLRNYSGTTMSLAANSVYNGVTRIHTLAVNKDTGYLYLNGTNTASGGIHIVNVNNQLSPVAAGTFSGDGYTHESQVVLYKGPDTTHVGKEIAFNSNGKQGATADTLSIVNVTNKSSIVRLSSKTYSGAGYIHQGWLTEDQQYFFQNDELDETGGLAPKTRTHMWDVRDLDNPIYRGFYEHAGVNVDHNLYVKGDLVFESNYTTGLRVLKIGDLTSTDPQSWLQEVAFFDTYQPNDGNSFNGAWNNYPYFPSGNIAISDINGGLFMVSLNPKALGGIKGIGESGGEIGEAGAMGRPVPEPGAIALTVLAGIALLRRNR